jgi:hypothetical protein
MIDHTELVRRFGYDASTAHTFDHADGCHGYIYTTHDEERDAHIHVVATTDGSFATSYVAIPIIYTRDEVIASAHVAFHWRKDVAIRKASYSLTPPYGIEGHV